MFILQVFYIQCMRYKPALLHIETRENGLLFYIFLNFALILVIVCWTTFISIYLIFFLIVILFLLPNHPHLLYQQELTKSSIGRAFRIFAGLTCFATILIVCWRSHCLVSFV